ncbi:MAG TPA: MFS transporter [Planctomycetota bacterium]|nr:MFS transporter [Planctomycetota bacterium]
MRTLTPTAPTLDPAAAARPAGARDRIVLFSALLAVLTYVDRVCISKAEPYLSAKFHLTDEQMGWVFAAFSLGYALFEVPGGWLGDRVGPRRVLTRIVLWWSVFTAATGWAWNFGSLLAIRFLFGAGEAGCFPNLTKALRTRLPEPARVRAQSILWLSARWGGALTPLIVTVILESGVISWRGLLLFFGSLGVVWALLFLRGTRDETPSAPAEAAVAVPWKPMLRSRTVGLLCLQYMCLNYAWFFYVTWLPRYLIEVLGVDGRKAALLNALPLFFGGIGCLVCGALAPRIAAWTGNTRTARRLLACAGYGFAAALLLVSVSLRDPLWAMIAMGLASFANDFVMPVSWTACMDVGGRHTGTLSGLMNMLGALVAGLASIVSGKLHDVTGSWTPTFYLSAGAYALGFLCWLFLDPVTPLKDESA